MARKKKQEEHENHERWLVSYADFITLLFAFFVVMYSISSVNEGKYRVLSDALVAAFRSPAKSLEPIQVGQSARTSMSDPVSLQAPFEFRRHMGTEMDQMGARDGRARPRAESPADALASIQREIEQAMMPLIEKDLIEVRRGQFWLEVEIKASILFDSGRADLSRGAIEVLQSLARVLKPHPNPLHIEGFTDNVPINTETFPSNWELSAARAASVVHLFTKLGITPARMAAVGFGEFRPIADNATETGRQKNRRVVLVVLASPETRDMPTLDRPQPQSGAAPTTVQPAVAVATAPNAATPAR